MQAHHAWLCNVQIRATFHLPDDLTDEEKLEPIKNLGEDPRIRLLNRLYAKRRKVHALSCQHTPHLCPVVCSPAVHS